ncbi:MAG: glycosyltransferase family 39 protein [Anaerolineae bacterium]|nr:glycosyltransferase family 39 protein [Anaerolineae bacterium]
MSAARRRWLWTLALIAGLAFALRLYRLDALPLRGDEAFSVRYVAADPRDTLRDLVRREPHPLGTFISFWAWKQAAGDSEFAMRYLPLLGNLIGVAAVAQLGRRLLRSAPAGLIAAALWAVNPYLIWHAQDVRNYAIWAGLSPLALWLFLRAADWGRPRAGCCTSRPRRWRSTPSSSRRSLSSARRSTCCSSGASGARSGRRWAPGRCSRCCSFRGSRRRGIWRTAVIRARSATRAPPSC